MSAEDPVGSRRELCELLVDSFADGVLSFDTECRYTSWNPQMERMSGMPASRVVGQVAFELFPFLVETGEERCFHEALAGRESVSVDRRFSIPQSGRAGFFEGRYAPLRDAHGRVIGGVGVIRDVSERREEEQQRLAVARVEAARVETEAAARRFAFLAEAGETLSSSLDYEQTLRQVAQLTLHVLADFCVVDVVEGSGLRRVAAAHVVPSKGVLVDELRRFSPTFDSPQPAARVLRSGQPELLPVVTPDVVAAHVMDAEHASLLRRLGIRSHLAVPLVARGATVGVISLGITESDRQYGAQDVVLASDLARRAAVAIDNARLHRAAQDELAERRRVDDALRMSEARFRALFEQSPLSTQIFSTDGVTVRVNPAFEHLWGVSLEKLAGYDILRDPQLEAKGIAPLLRRAAGGEPVELPAIRYDPQETLPDLSEHAEPARWVRAFAYPIKAADGAVGEVVLMHEDVTDRLRGEERVRKSEERLRVALAGARMSVWDWDLTTGRVVCSDNAREFWGADIQRVDDILALVHPADRSLFSAIADASAGDEDDSYRAEFRLAGPGAERWVQSRGRIERSGGVATRIIGVTVDVTERKAAEAATRLLADAGETLGTSLDTHETLRDLARLVIPRIADACAVDMVAADGSLERVSFVHPDSRRVSAAAELFRRYPPRPGSPRGPWRVIESGEPEWAETVDDAVLRTVARDADHHRLLEQLGIGSYLCVPIVARGAPVGALTLAYVESGRRFTAPDVAIAADLARRAAIAVENARLYERLRDEDERKDAFLATLAHELRNPLAPIRTGLAVLRTAASETVTEKVRSAMDRQVTHMARLIDDLLDVARVTQDKIDLQLAPLTVRSAIESALELSGPVLAAAGLDVSVDVVDEPVVHADKTRLAQVLSNVLNNAAKYTPRGGTVSVAVLCDARHAVVRVRDTGIGIPRDMLARVFDVFVQVERTTHGDGGLGIGLTLARRLVELHGGTVTIDSEGRGRGTEVVIRLPLAGDGLPAEAPAPSPERSLPDAPRRILVVEDNDDAAEMLEMLLAADGHETRRASSAEEAMAVLETFSPDLAFLDIGLPGKSGLELARDIRSAPRHADVLLVAMTGWGQAEDRRRSQAAGFDHHLTKPVDVRKVEDLVAGTRRRAVS